VAGALVGLDAGAHAANNKTAMSATKTVVLFISSSPFESGIGIDKMDHPYDNRGPNGPMIFLDYRDKTLKRIA